jgi:hypothetical protein
VVRLGLVQLSRRPSITRVDSTQLRNYLEGTGLMDKITHLNFKINLNSSEAIANLRRVQLTCGCLNII